MAALVASVAATPGANGGATTAVDTTGATFLLLSVSSYGSGPVPTVSDAKGNTYLGLTSRTTGSTRHRFFYCFTPTVGTGHTFTASGTGTYPAVIAYAFSGVASYESESGAGFTGGTSLASGSVTPSANGALVVTGNCGQNAVTDSVTPGGFTLTQKSFVGGVNMQGSAAYYIQPTAAAINPTWGFSPAQGQVQIGTAVFLADAAPPPPPGAHISQSPLEVLGQWPTSAHVSQAPLETVQQFPAALTTARVSQAPLEIIYPFGCYPRPTFLPAPICPTDLFPIDPI